LTLLGARPPDTLSSGLVLLRLSRGGCAISLTSRTPRRATSVSILLRSFNGYSCVSCPFGAAALAAASCSACSLCCQQKNAAAPVSSPSVSLSFATETTARTPSFLDAISRLHGRPDFVIPLHVVAGFLESDRGRSDSGVCPMNAAMAERSVEPRGTGEY